MQGWLVGAWVSHLWIPRLALCRCHYLILLQLPQEGTVKEESKEVSLVVGESP